MRQVPDRGKLANADVPPRPRLLPGRLRPKGEAGTTAHAYALGCLARAEAVAARNGVVAVLFRDSDGTRSAANGLWQGKVDAINQGFNLLVLRLVWPWSRGLSQRPGCFAP